MEITLEDIIKEGTERLSSLKDEGDFLINYIYDDMDSYYQWIEKAKRFIEITYPNDKHVTEFEKLSKEQIMPNQQKQLLAILKAFSDLPTIIPNKDITKTSDKTKQQNINVTNNINNSQTQNQEQNVAFQIFTEAIKDELTGRQIKELKEIIKINDNNLEKSRPSLLQKIKSFGTDVASNIIANIITNPNIFNFL